MPDNDKTTDDKTEDKTNTKTGDEKPQDFAAFIAAQDEPTKALYKKHTDGLKSALDSERENRRTLEKELREAAASAEDGSEAKQKLEEAHAATQKASARSEFLEKAHAAGVADLSLAWLAVQEDDTLRDQSGNANFAKLKEKHPALFTDAKKLPAGHAAAGASSDAPKPDVNANLRAAGKR